MSKNKCGNKRHGRLGRNPHAGVCAFVRRQRRVHAAKLGKAAMNREAVLSRRKGR